MAVSRQPEMTQFFQEIEGYNDTDGSLRITFRAFGNTSAEKSLTLPLTPDTAKLEPYEVILHNSPTPAFKMPAKYIEWFTSCFGYEVMLVYLGTNTRPVLFEDMQPIEPDPLTRFLRDKLPFTKGYVERIMGLRQNKQWRISFADCAPYLIASQTSLEDVSSRLPDGTEMDMEKFRPNIVVAGAFEAYQEDYWGKLKINNKTEIIMAHNCVRCASINIDYNTGKPGAGPEGQVLKKLQHDRRIDIGAKWSPVFGRYSFWGVRDADEMIRVGDRVNVSKVNDGLTIWSKWIFLSFPALGRECYTNICTQVGRGWHDTIAEHCSRKIDGCLWTRCHIVEIYIYRNILLLYPPAPTHTKSPPMEFTHFTCILCNLPPTSSPFPQRSEYQSREIHLSNVVG
jgi:hypothetical protein